LGVDNQFLWCAISAPEVGLVQLSESIMIMSSSSLQRCLHEGTITIDPFQPQNLKGGSYTFGLDSEYFELLSERGAIDLRTNQPRLRSRLMTDAGLELEPQSFFVCQTRETVNLNGQYSCLLSGRGSCAQIGLNVLQSSLFVEPGTTQKLRLEISNAGPYNVMIYPGMLVVKGIFVPMSDALVDVPMASSNSSLQIVA
jgi:deoxycytidine triphosphate deaminase